MLFSQNAFFSGQLSSVCPSKLKYTQDPVPVLYFFPTITTTASPLMLPTKITSRGREKNVF